MGNKRHLITQELSNPCLDDTARTLRTRTGSHTFRQATPLHKDASPERRSNLGLPLGPRRHSRRLSARSSRPSRQEVGPSITRSIEV